jgi:cell wall-associated NlpC family hydrolase
MSQERRRFLIGLGIAPLALSAGMRAVLAETPEKKVVPDFPDAATFRTGDLVWPKKKGTIVPKTRSIGSPAATQERREWEVARQQMLADPAAAGLSPEVAERLKTMSYEEFERVYFQAQAQPPPGAISTRSAAAVNRSVSVGHVGLVEVDRNGVPYIVEATPKTPEGARGGVIRVRYPDWLKAYTNIQVWHGRFRGLDAAASKRVVDMASDQLGKPYDFFNFDLNDDRGFYCSKLVWFSVWRAAQIAADDNPDPKRGNRFPPWFSPKALIGASRITMLHNPGDY